MYYARASTDLDTIFGSVWSLDDELVAHFLQHIVEVPRERGTLGHLACESECGSIEQPPGGLVAPVVLRPFPLIQNVRNNAAHR
jgi:hypothetical protein